jgi:hypothetical protein
MPLDAPIRTVAAECYPLAGDGGTGEEATAEAEAATPPPDWSLTRERSEESWGIAPQVTGGCGFLRTAARTSTNCN